MCLPGPPCPHLYSGDGSSYVTRFRGQNERLVQSTSTREVAGVGWGWEAQGPVLLASVSLCSAW